MLALIGAGAVLERRGQELRALVERFQIPFVTTLDGKGIIPEDHPLALGVLFSSGNKGAREASWTPTGAGRRELLRAVRDVRLPRRCFEGKTLIHVNIDRSEIGKVYPADHALVSDAKPAIAALTAELARSVEGAAGTCGKTATNSTSLMW